MQQTQHKPLGEDEYLEAEATSSVRHELIGGQAYTMAGASVRHNRIALNLASRLLAADGADCQVYISDIKLKADSQPTYYYPDVMLVCDKSDDDPLIKTRPCLLAEVLSSATEAIDRREKLAAYQRLPSLKEYLLIDQDQPRVELYRRQNLREWVLQTLTPPDELKLECLGLTLPAADLYAGLPPVEQ
jgi:Uma2 family endonuclease